MRAEGGERYPLWRWYLSRAAKVTDVTNVNVGDMGGDFTQPNGVRWVGVVDQVPIRVSTNYVGDVLEP